ncbi:MAG: BACON domain-containing protein [Planctomycetes bacterium]|nr:BACON domain-containing protein [Planctomycetota bacterium]
MRCSAQHSDSVGSSKAPRSIAGRAWLAASVIALALASGPGGCNPSDSTAPDDRTGTVVAGITIENPPGQDPNDPSVPSAQVDLGGGTVLEVRPSELDFGTDYSQIGFTLRNIGTGAVDYSVVSDSIWASVEPSQGSTSGERDGVMVSVDRIGMPAGAFTGSVTVHANGGAIPIALRMSVRSGAAPSSNLVVSPTSLDFGATTDALTLGVRADGAIPISYTLAADATWINLQTASGTSSGETDSITVTVSRDDIPPGAATGRILVSGNGQTITVTVSAIGSDTRLVTGHVRSGGLGVAGVSLEASGSAGAVLTTADGYFEIAVPYGWHGTLTPKDDAHLHNPTNRVLVDVRRRLENQDFESLAPSGAVPPIFIRYDDGQGRIYRDQMSYSDDRMSATIRLVGEQQWELSLNNQGHAITEVWFPWDWNQVKLNDNLVDDVLFTTLFAGVARLPHEAVEWGWNGFVYPGGAFAPLNVLADPYRARIMAATNWPPRRVSAMWSLHRMALRYADPLGAYQTQTYRALSAMVEGDAANGLDPWMLAADKYAAWLKPSMQAAGKYPNYAPWFRHCKGWLHVGLMNMVAFDPNWLRTFYSLYRDHFPIVQCWGEMSNYAGADYPPVPPLEPGEQVGCCIASRELHPRYDPGLVEFADWLHGQGGKLSLYTRPRTDPATDMEYMLDDTTIINGETNLQWYREWMRRNLQDRRSDLLYLDVLGRRNLGTPEALWAAMEGVPPESVTEGVVDIYAATYLIAGFIGGQSAGGLPDRPLERLGQGFSTTSVPRFARYLLPDREFLLGQTNLDENLWGPAANHLVERQAFLMGTKLDVMTPWADHLHPEVMEAMLASIIAEWDRVGWWLREPQYRDRFGITNLPAGVDARYFVDRDGLPLLVIENWQQLSAVPTAKLSIVEPVSTVQ